MKRQSSFLSAVSEEEAEYPKHKIYEPTKWDNIVL